MKKIVGLLVALFLFAMSASAEELLYPRADGNDDVVVPDQLIQAIPGYDSKKPVYAATDVNGWFVRGSKFTSAKILDATKMAREGEGTNVFWRVKGLKALSKDRRFHPVQLDESGKPKWALIEEVYPLESEFVDTSNKEGPCLLVK